MIKKLPTMIAILLILALISNPLLNVYKYKINSSHIKLFLNKYKAEKVYIGRFPFFARFIGYTTSEPIKSRGKFYNLTLNCSFHTEDSKLIIDLIEMKKPNITIVRDKKIIPEGKINNYLQKDFIESEE